MSCVAWGEWGGRVLPHSLASETAVSAFMVVIEVHSDSQPHSGKPHLLTVIDCE